MSTRIFSWVVCRFTTFAVAATATTVLCSPVNAQNGAGYFTDPATGIVYQKVIKTVERPVVETKTQTQKQTVYRPQTVVETKPETRTIYTPVVEYNWEARVEGRWNPFQQPRVAYHHVPNTRWEARKHVVEKRNTRTEWVAEDRTIEVPQKVMRMEREQQVGYEPVGNVNQQQAAPQGVSSSVASRLRPLDPNTPVQTFGQSSNLAPRTVASTAGRMTSDPPRRSTGQGGMRATELYDSAPNVRGQALPPVTGGSGMATLPSIPSIFR